MQTPDMTLSASPEDKINRIRAAVRDIPDFPKPGILFKDITTVLKDPLLLRETIDLLAEPLQGLKIDKIVGIESRGFILGAPLAMKLGVGFVPARKMGKLPGLVERHKYDLEYGSDCVEIHIDAIQPGERVVLIDDLLATGGTAAAVCTLIHKLQGELVNISFLIELDFLNGRNHLPQTVPTYSLLHYSGE